MRSPRTSGATDFLFDLATLDMAELPSISMARNLQELPDEVLSHIFLHLDPEETLLNVQLVSRRIYTLAQEPLLWRHHCRARFHYWHERHDIQRRFKADIGETDWVGLFLERRHANATTSRLMDSILSEQIGRIAKTNQISDLGYDAKDTLLRHRNTDLNAPDVLARKYHSNAVLDHIHRAEALKVWQRLTMQQVGRHSDIALERALGSFDMFILHEHLGDLDEIAELLDQLKEDVLQAHPHFRHFGLQQKALTALQYLRDYGFTGLDDEGRYRDFQNNYIGASLQDSKHPSLPLISTAVYCAVARRLGLDASFVNYPHHVYAIVTIEDDKHMYLDPWRSAEEVPIAKLVAPLVDVNVPVALQRRYLGPATLQSMVTRLANNVLESCKADAMGDNDWFVVRGKGLNHPTADANDAIYSTVWAVYMMSTVPGQAHIAIPTILRTVESDYPMDGVFIEEYICKRPGYLGEEMKELIRDTIKVTRTSDFMPKATKRRDGSGFRDNVLYQIGQVFMHKRERYTGVIYGWDEQCKAQNTWIRQQGVDNLPRGRSQSFYHSLVHDATSRYVAEENIEILEPTEPPEALLPIAGKYFKRWDKGMKRFVSNIEDEYPDN